MLPDDEQKNTSSRRYLRQAYTITLGNFNFLFPSKKMKVKEEKPCLNCGTPKIHNNSFCSARCCSEYRERKKQ